MNHFRTDSELVLSTMVDYYGMPHDWPVRASSFTAAMSASDRANEIEEALLRDVSNEIGHGLRSEPICALCNDARIRGDALQRL